MISLALVMISSRVEVLLLRLVGRGLFAASVFGAFAGVSCSAGAVLRGRPGLRFGRDEGSACGVVFAVFFMSIA